MLETPGLMGAIAGSAIGVAGGLFGTWMSIRNSPRGKQRSLMVKAAILCWAGVLGFTATLLLVPPPWKWLLWILYGPALVLFIRYVNRSQIASRAEHKLNRDSRSE